MNKTISINISTVIVLALILVTIGGGIMFVKLNKLESENLRITEELASQKTDVQSTSSKIVAEQIPVTPSTTVPISNTKTPVSSEASKTTKTTQTSGSISLADLIEQWENHIVIVDCRWLSTKDGSILSESYGSGLLISATNGMSFVNTNKHVVKYSNSIAQDCDILLPKFNEKYNVHADWEKMTMPDIATFDGYDLAQVTITEPTTIIKNQSMNPKQVNVCQEKPRIGDAVVVLGYPAIGSRESITATEGIISGIETGYFVTSAKIDEGNSGGVAVLVDKNCYLGIPTSAQVGGIESLGRILDYKYLSDNNIYY